MSLKKYTLYFKGENKYGHEHNLKIVSMDLKRLDEYTSNYVDYVQLFSYLPNEIKTYIKNNLGNNIDFNNNEKLKEHFFITDYDFNPIMDVIFEDDLDVLYINEDELDDLVIKEKMTYDEINKCKLTLNSKNKINRKYEFFKYLYFTYVKNKKIACMVDCYEANINFPNLDVDELMVISLATDKTNIKVLCKKLSQNMEARRNLTFKYKALFKKLNTLDAKIINYTKVAKRKNENLNHEEIIKEMFLNLEEFEKKYNKEYKIS